MTKKQTQRDLFPGALEMMILRTLKRQPLHGYALVQHIKRTSNDLLQIEEGSLYPALQRLLEGRAGEGGMGRVCDKPAGEDLQADRGGSEASGAGSIEFRTDAERDFAGAGAG